MRLPSVLDLLSAIRRVAPNHPSARTWWLTPRARLPVKGETSLAERSVRVIELGVEGPPERGSKGPPEHGGKGSPEHGGKGSPDAALDCARIERELSDLLPGTMITVRALAPSERQGMMRLFTAATVEGARETGSAVSEAPKNGTPKNEGALSTRDALAQA